MFDFSGKTVLITGASYGLGEGFALAFARAGADLVLTARSAELLESVAGRCRSEGAAVTTVVGDVSIEADVELGVTDQLYNLLAGRTVMEAYGLEPQVVLTTPLLLSWDSAKMSSSVGNNIPLTAPPEEQFGRTMRIPDEMLGDWYRLVLEAPVPDGDAMDAKLALARFIVTRSHGSVLLKLDGRPAEAVYLEKIGVGDVPLSDDDFEAIAMAHPLAQPELRGDVRPRYVRGRMPGGGLVCATSIETNAAVDVCEQKPEAIVRSGVDAVDEAVGHLSGPAEAVLLFDCAARSARFGNPLAAREIESIISSAGDPPPAIAGTYTRGEIGRIRGAKGDRNYSLVVVAFGSSG